MHPSCIPSVGHTAACPWETRIGSSPWLLARAVGFLPSVVFLELGAGVFLPAWQRVLTWRSHRLSAC